jgi:hypothetical protein
MASQFGGEMLRNTLVFVVVFVAGCAGSSPPPTTPSNGPLAGELVDAEGRPAPTWVTAPSKYKAEEAGEQLLRGEGSIGNTRNLNLAQSTAAGRARTALAGQLETKVTSMLKDYQSTTTGGEQFGEAGNDEQHVVSASKQVTQTSLSGTEVRETWISSKSTLHSLVCLNVERFKGIVKQMAQLDESVRAAVVARAEQAWGELDELQDR